MNMSQRYGSVLPFGSVQPGRFDPERIPQLERVLVALTVPGEHTPRGVAQTTREKREAQNMRDGRTHEWGRILRQLFLRRRRGEPVERVTAALTRLKAELRDADDPCLLELAKLDIEAESVSAQARTVYAASPTPENEARWKQAELVEIDLSERIAAYRAQRALT